MLYREIIAVCSQIHTKHKPKYTVSRTQTVTIVCNKVYS
jgi:hypothetical protein